MLWRLSSPFAYKISIQESCIKGLVISRESMFEDMDTFTGLFNLEILKEPEVREDQLTW